MTPPAWRDNPDPTQNSENDLSLVMFNYRQKDHVKQDVSARSLRGLEEKLCLH